MKRAIGGLMMIGVLLLSGGATPFAADGDLLVNGSLGVGTTNPQAKLDVNGSIRTGAGQSFKIRYGSATVDINLAPLSGVNYGPYAFGHTFASPPIVVVSGFGAGGSLLNPQVASVSTTEFTVRVGNCNSVNTAAISWTFYWIAVGE